MKSTIVHSSGPVVLVGGGDCQENLLKSALERADCIVAADGGAEIVLGLGMIPHAVFGDMDSLAPNLQAQLPGGVLRRIAEQDSTDFDKALRHIEAPLVLAHGFLGKRLDHTLAALTVLARRADRLCVLIGRDDIAVICPPQLHLDLPKGTRLSLFPMGPVRGQSLGLRWPIDGIDFAPSGTVGTSNEVTDAVSLTMEAPEMVLILPQSGLDALLSGLDQAPRWPARA